MKLGKENKFQEWTARRDIELQSAHGIVSLIWEAMGSLGEGVCHDQKVISRDRYRYIREKQSQEMPEEEGPIRSLLRYFRPVGIEDMNPDRICGNGEVRLGNRYSKMGIHELFYQIAERQDREWEK